MATKAIWCKANGWNDNKFKPLQFKDGKEDDNINNDAKDVVYHSADLTDSAAKVGE